MNARQTFAALRRQGSRLLICEHDDRLWVTNTYWIIPLAGTSIEGLLHDYNLTPEPMCCDVDRTIRRNPAEPPEPGHMFPAKKDKLVPIGRKFWSSRPLQVASPIRKGSPCGLWEDHDGATLALREDLLSFVEAQTKVIDWKHRPDKQYSPVVGYDPDGEVCALVMPVRIS